MHSMQAPFCRRYRLLSAADRRVGSQGIVQFAVPDDTQDTVRGPSSCDCGACPVLCGGGMLLLLAIGQ